MEFLESIDLDCLNTEALPSYIPTTSSWVGASVICSTKEPKDSFSTLNFAGRAIEDDTRTFQCVQKGPNKINIAEAYSSVERQGMSSKVRHLFGAILLDWSIAFGTNNMTRPLLPSTVALVRSMRQLYSSGVSKTLLKKRNDLPHTAFIVPSGGRLLWDDAPIIFDE